MTLEQQTKNFIHTMEESRLENRKMFALLEALLNGNYDVIQDPPEGHPLHPEYGKEFISESVNPETDIPY